MLNYHAADSFGNLLEPCYIFGAITLDMSAITLGAHASSSTCTHVFKQRVPVLSHNIP